MKNRREHFGDGPAEPARLRERAAPELAEPRNKLNGLIDRGRQAAGDAASATDDVSAEAAIACRAAPGIAKRRLSDARRMTKRKPTSS